MLLLDRSAAHLVVLAACGSLHLNAGLIVESATFPSAQFPAAVVVNGSFAQQAFGVRFQITQPVQVTAVGVALYGNEISSGLFGEIFPLSGPTSFPLSDPYSSVGLGRAQFTFSSQLADVSAPLSVTLSLGYYALVVGMADEGEAGIPMTGTDNPGFGQGSYIAYLGGDSFPSPPFPRWQTVSAGMRFLLRSEVNASEIPEPLSLFLMGWGLMLLPALAARARRAPHQNRNFSPN